MKKTGLKVLLFILVLTLSVGFLFFAFNWNTNPTNNQSSENLDSPKVELETRDMHKFGSILNTPCTGVFISGDFAFLSSSGNANKDLGTRN